MVQVVLRSVMCAGLLLELMPRTAAAQQREPAVELFALGGVYRFGNTFWVLPWWRSEFGGGVLAPLGTRWGLLCDVATSRVEGHRLWGGYFFPEGRGDGYMFSELRRLSLTPSVVRLWRRDRFSIYGGLGVGFERDWQRTRLVVIATEGTPGRILHEGPEQRDVLTRGGLALRAGALVSLTRRFVLRTGYRYVRVYADEAGAMAFELGLGYRLAK